MSMTTFVGRRAFAPHQRGNGELCGRRSTCHGPVQSAHALPQNARPRVSVEPTLVSVANPDRLFAVFESLQSDGGPGAGVDGLTYADFGRGEIRAAIRALSADLIAERYVPEPHRVVRVPKGGGRFRELRLRTVLDRVVSKSLLRAIGPRIEPVFLDSSYAFRPNRSVATMLAAISQAVCGENRTWIAQDDVRDAFPSVRIDDALADFGRHVSDPGLRRLLGVVLRGNDRSRSVGLDQGDPLAPLAFNLRLHYALDAPLTAAPGGIAWFRYADNLGFLGHDATECDRLLQQARTLLQTAGMELKGDSPRPTNLGRQGTTVDLLGFSLSLDGERLRLDIGRNAFAALDVGLERTWDNPAPAQAARQAIEGWIGAFGPALEDAERRKAILRRIRETALRHGHRECLDEDALERLMEQAGEAWRQLRCQVLGRRMGAREG